MTLESPKPRQIEHILESLNTLSARVGLIGEEKVFALSTVRIHLMKLDKKTDEFENLRREVGLETAATLEEWMDLNFEAYSKGKLDEEEIFVLEEQLRIARRNDEVLRRIRD